ncbi:Unknown protein [Striga hermonthica]|uniref:Retrotransposon Copia-like N-terminal domain-containing protein n=1 Tax=Striga hermonthica TaxID=68872 RepID=A0A9N7MQS2_STRHE|nr:Unknown protein [Striga hermonthica]
MSSQTSTDNILQPTAPTTPSFIQPQHQFISIKLTDSNYLLWKQQTHSAIIGYGLENFIDAEYEPPQKFISDENTSQLLLNPAYAAWLRQGQLLLSWHLSSLTENHLIMMESKNTSKDVWLSVEANFSRFSKARLMHHKLQLQTLKKGSSTMREFLGKIKECCDALGIACEPVTDQNQILYILAGLGTKYNPAVVAVTSRVEPYTLNEVYTMLLSLESRLEVGVQSIVNPDGSLPSVNLTSSTSINQKTNSNFSIPTQTQRVLSLRGVEAGQTTTEAGVAVATGTTRTGLLTNYVASTIIQLRGAIIGMILHIQPPPPCKPQLKTKDNIHLFSHCLHTSML